MAHEVGTSVPAVISSSVVLLREAAAVEASSGAAEPPSGAGDVEVLLLERHLDSDFAGGAYVFPGGKVDAADRELDPGRWTGRPLSWWAPRLGVGTDDEALGLLVCAVRETFEESGVLLATEEDGTPLSYDRLASRSFAEARRRLAERGTHWDWRGWLDDEGITLDLGALALLAWWVTPAGMHRRFDTRFFAATLPVGQVAAHDDVETTDLVWTRPEEALERHARGAAVIIFPTRRILAGLAGRRAARDVWAEAVAGSHAVARIEPRIVVVDGTTMVQHPFEDEPSLP